MILGDFASPPENNTDSAASYTGSKLMSQEGVYQLTKDLRTFSEALTSLKAVFLDERSKSKQFLQFDLLVFYLF